MTLSQIIDAAAEHPLGYSVGTLSPIYLEARAALDANEKALRASGDSYPL